VVLLVHFFDATGHQDGIDDPKKIKEEDFRAWMGAVRDAVYYARNLPHVKRERVGLLGFSLGGFLCLSVAADKEVKVAAVGSYFGGVPDKLCPDLHWLPPTLVVAGGKDRIVPVSHAYTLIGFCQVHGLPCTHKIYPKEGHLFQEALMIWVLRDRLWGREKWWLSQSIARAIRNEPTLREAVSAGTDFFKKHLEPPGR
jgi:dienelactone hydrolase